jgi:hypothetical protein
MKKIVSFLVIVVSFVACQTVINQNVFPVGDAGIRELCIFKNTHVRTSLLDSLIEKIEKRGISTRVLNASEDPVDCEHRMTYLARWSWDVALYMSYIELKVFRGEKLIGKAVYDATMGSDNLDKFIRADGKVEELVNALFGSP